jgi:hypothetical protein
MVLVYKTRTNSGDANRWIPLLIYLFAFTGGILKGTEQERANAAKRKRGVSYSMRNAVDCCTTSNLS